MKISIITVVYNNLINIEESINSCLSQDYNDIEYIIIDGKSNDGTVEIIKKYLKKGISKFVSEPDEGIYDAFNKGVFYATGEIVGFLHSDDLFENPSVITNIAKTFKNFECDGVYGNLKYVSANNTKKVIRRWISSPFRYSQLTYGWMPPHPTFFLKKTVYNKYGNFNKKYKISADYDFMIRVLKQKELQFKYIPQFFCKMRMGGNSNSISNIIPKMKEDFEIIKKNKIGGFSTLIFKNLSKIKQFL